MWHGGHHREWSMAKRATIVLTGSDRLNRKLLELTSAQAKAAIRSAARPALQPTLQAARALCPARDGNLRRSIRIRAIRRSRTRVGARVTTSKSDSQFTGQTFYGGFQEWGWKTGSRRNHLEAATKRFASRLRNESRAAKALAKNGTAFRDRQEAYFRHEGARRALGGKYHTRKQVPAKNFLKRAAQRTRSSALQLYARGISAYIRKITKQ